MPIEASDIYKWCNDEIARYRNLEWQLAAYSMAGSWAVLLVATGSDKFQAYREQLELLVAFFCLLIFAAQSYVHYRLGQFREQRKRLTPYPESPPLDTDRRLDMLIFGGFLIAPLAVGVWVIMFLRTL
jgi:hypothetical protein